MAGALLFALPGGPEEGAWSGTGVEAGDRLVVIDARRIRGLQRDYRLAHGTRADEGETRALVEKVIDEEILFREGIARGFEYGDRAIAWRLVQKMHYLDEDEGDDPVTVYRRALELGLHLSDPVVRGIMVEKVRLVIGLSVPVPSDVELAKWYADNRDRFGQPPRVTLRHAFFARDSRGADGARTAAAAALEQARGRGPEAWRDLGGDPFLSGTRLAAQRRADLEKLFGPGFAAAVETVADGRWQGPVESAFGWHLVFVEQREGGRVPALDEVRTRVEKQYQNDRRAEHVAGYLRGVRSQYRIQVDEDAIVRDGGSHGRG